MQYSHIVFYDGDCGLCNRSVQFLIKKDKEHILYYAPLQGKTALELLPQTYTSELNTIVYYHQGILFTKSDAILIVLQQLSLFKYSIYTLVSYLPLFFRNSIYDIVACYRKQFFFNRSCAVFSEQERRYFLP